jgi:hypothetical protein
MGNVVPINFNAKGHLEQYMRRSSPGKRVREGTLKELIEYACARRAMIGIFRITVGTDKYTGQEIRNPFDSPNFLKRVK